MPRSRNTSAWLVLWGGLVFLGFQRVAPVERALEVALAPLRLAAELAWPFALLGRGQVAAAERELARDAQAEASAGAAALALLAARARPRDPALCAGRAFVPVEVIARANRDECWVALGAAARVAPGAPAVCGDVFVGRVVERSANRARVQLVTEASFRVGAQVHLGGEAPAGAAGPDADGEPVYLTVGGLRTPRRRAEARAVRLAVHQPSSSALAGGLARVHELFADADDFAALAEGFRLGAVRREGERGAFWIEPELDYLDGLLQLALVVPAAESEPAAAPPAPVQADGRWLATRALTFGDPSPWRSTLKIPLGRGAGVRAGAAVTGPGASLVGRVARAGGNTSDVVLVTDAGFSCVAIAEVEGEHEPRILGRITTMGRGAGGTIRLCWSVRQPLAGASGGEAESVRARLFTGSGEPGLPGGLVLGTVLLPRSAAAGEERELELDPGVDPLDVHALFVRCEEGGGA